MQPDQIVMYLHHLSGTRCVLTIKKTPRGLNANVSIRDPRGIKQAEADLHSAVLMSWVNRSIEEDPRIFNTPPPGWRFQA